MDKTTFCYILEAALLHFDGSSETEIINQGIPGNLTKTGIILCNHIKNLEVNTNER